MDKETSVQIDSKVEKAIRSIREKDHIIHLAGVDNNIISILKIQSSINEHSSEVLESDLLTYLPSNLKINGFILIYNENLYEDSDEAININIEILKKEYGHITQSNLYIFVLKDVLYIENSAKLEFEQLVKYDLETSNKIDISYEVTNCIDILNKNYLFLYSNIEFTFSKEKINGCYNIDVDNQKEYDTNKLSMLFNDVNFFVDDFKSLSSEKIVHITKFLMKLSDNKANVS